MNFIYNMIALLLPTKSIDGIVKQLNKVTQRLTAAEASHIAAAEDLRRKAEDLARRANELQNGSSAALLEAERAARVRNNISQLTA